MQIKGFKKTAGKERRPIVAKDTIANTSMVKILYGLSEGEVYGLADGAKSIRLDGTPIVNSSGQPNFAGVRYEFRSGTNDQTHIAGFSSVENEINVNVELRHDRPFVKQIKGAELSAFRIRLSFGRIAKQESNGDIGAYRIDYAIDVQTDNGAYNEVLKTYIHDKTSQGYKKSHRIDLPKGKKWQVRVRRLTENANNDMIGDTMHVEAITEIIDAKLRYPNTALLGLEYDAKTFSNIAKVAARLKGMIIRVPSNYNPDTREYIGLWDGAFKMAYSNNPAWVFYDICTAKRYGLGSRLDGQMVDKWSLYRLGQYCDEKVSDGKGGQEPRFTCNVYLQNKMDAYEVLQNLAGIFRALSYWDGQKVVVDGDFPKDAVYTFARANVINGHFSYTGTRDRDRHTVAKVAWDNPENDFKTEYEIVKNDMAIAKRGIKTLDLSAFGCTSQGQAQRAGRWALMAESLETRQVSFSVGLDGFIPQIGDVINVSDELFAGRANGGRIIAINGKVITVDRTINKTVQAGDTLVINGTNGKAEYRQVTAINNDKITVIAPFEFASVEHIWSLDSADLRLMKFRVIRIGQRDEGSFDITAIQYEPQKYKAVDEDTDVRPTAISLIEPDTIKAPTNVLLSSKQRIEQGQTVTTLTISWGQVAGATSYIVQWRKSDGVWQTVTVGNTSLDIEGIYAGSYQARVAAVSAFDDASTYTNSALTTISGKQGRPPKPTAISASGGLFSMVVSWTHAKGSEDANYTEIQVSPDGRSNIATLGQFAYPTNKHEITGLQGNLTQFYRARIVDKLGNASDWTAWTSGTTEARADKVLDIISGQIRDSHLDQTLRTPIGKIGGIESGLNGIKGQIPSLQSAISAINGQLPTLNTKIATTERHLQTAQSTLQTAVANITTERNRITSAIRDITALQNANNAKTQEIANLVQTMGNHTSSIRELGVTTGELAQKYSQLKTVADKATSDITAIRQTQAGQATSIEQMNSKFGWQTLTTATDLNTLTTQGNYFITGARTNSPVNAWVYLIVDVPRSDRITQTAWADNAPNTTYRRTRAGTTWTAWEKMATGAELSTKASSADMQTLRQTVADSDSALGHRIDSVETAYRQADTQANAKIDSEITARTSADSALGQRIDTLQSDYNGNKANIANQIKTLSDKDVAVANQISNLTANFTTANNKADAAKRTADDALGKANTANTAITAEQKARADGDSSLASRITALDAAYKKADTDMTARVAREETARADADKANAQAVKNLESTVQGVSGRIGTAESKIGTLERTTTDTKQALATTQSQLNVSYTNLDNKVNNLSIGGRNLLVDSDFKRGKWLFAGHNNQVTHRINNGVLTLGGSLAYWKHAKLIGGVSGLNDVLQIGKTYTFSVWARSTQGRKYVLISIRNWKDGQFSENIAKREQVGETWQRISVTGVYRQTPHNGQYLDVLLEHGEIGEVEFKQPKLEVGNVATDWTPAPEDTEQDFVQTNANMNTMRETLTNADKALSQRIDTMDSEYKAADRQTSAKLGQLEKTISDKDGSTAQRISQLQAEYNALNARTDWRIIEQQIDLNALKEQGKYFIKAANNPNAPTTNWIYVTVDYAFNRRIKQEVWADNYAHQRYVRLWMDNRWSDWEQTPSNADVANKASQAALTAEQNARAEADRAHAESLRQLNSRVDGNASRITTVERTANDTKQALATAHSQLSASYTNLDNKVNNLSIGGRNLLPNTRLMGGAWQVASHNGQTQKHHDGEVVRIAGNTQDWKHLAIHIDKAKALEWLGTSRDFVLSVSIRRVSQTPNKLISLALRKGLTRGFSDNQLGGNVNPTNQWTRYSIKGTITPDDLQYLYVRFEWWDDSEYEFKHPKLEFGTIATDYTPAPEDNDALIDEFKQVQATKDGAIAQTVKTLQTTVNGQTASIEQHTQSLNGLQAQWTLKMQTGGVVGGIGLAGNNGVIDFAVNANKFYIAPPTGGKGITPFVVLTSPQILNGVRVPAGTYIRSAFIQDGSIDIAKINKASINSLSALSANIGHFKSAQTGARLEIKDSVLLVYDANNTLRVRLGLW